MKTKDARRKYIRRASLTDSKNLLRCGFLLSEGSAERRDGETCKFEALLPEGNADDGDAPDDARETETDAKFESAENDPDNVGDRVLPEILIHHRAEGPERKARKFEALLPEGNPDDGDAPDESEDRVRKPRPQSR